MFDRRRMPMFLSVLLCIALAAGFIPYSMGLLPMLESLYFDGWWTLLLIFPSLAKFAEDGYSRPALAVLASGLLLFANALGKIPAGMLPKSIAYTALASVAGGAVIELTERHLKKKHAVLSGTEPPKFKEKQSPFAPEAQPKKKVSTTDSTYIPKRASSNTSDTQTGWIPPAKEASKTKGWNPNQTYTRPRNARMRTVDPKNIPQKQTNQSPALHSSDSFPLSIAIFGNSQTSSNSQNLSGGLVLSLFGNAKLSLREADYLEPISVTMLSVFGETKLEVPYVSNLSISSIPIFGDCKDKRKLVNSQAMPMMSVHCISIFGNSSIN